MWGGAGKAKARRPCTHKVATNGVERAARHVISDSPLRVVLVVFVVVVLVPKDGRAPWRAVCARARFWTRTVNTRVKLLGRRWGKAGTASKKRELSSLASDR